MYKSLVGIVEPPSLSTARSTLFRSAGELFHATARRYAECWQRLRAPGSALNPRRLVHGFDASAMGHDAVRARADGSLGELEAPPE